MTNKPRFIQAYKISAIVRAHNAAVKAAQLYTGTTDGTKTKMRNHIRWDKAESRFERALLRAASSS